MKKMTKKQKVLKLLSTGKNITWQTIRDKFDLTSPRAMVDTLRNEGHCIYTNKVNGKTAYRLGEPSKGVIAAGLRQLLGSDYSYENRNEEFVR